jgi:serine/threonine protein kinase
MEHWDDTLAGVLPERALTSAEASEMLESILPAISHLHSLGLVHGGIRPASIVSSGGKIKLETQDPRSAGQGRFSTATDIMAVGATLAECLTRDRSGVAPMPEPFGAIVRRCMRDEPSKRPSATEVLALLRGEYVEHPEPVTVSETVAAPRLVSKRPVLWAGAGLIGITALLASLTLRQPSPKPVPRPVPPVVALPAAPATPSPQV